MPAFSHLNFPKHSNKKNLLDLSKVVHLEYDIRILRSI